ncbi:MAG: hypothetical protein RJA76_555 [Bacteroidota bacterium]|jgi:hypothetical protein
MKTIPLNFMDLEAVELTFNELIHIEGGGFWKTVGYIVGALAVVAIAYYAPVVLALIN